MKLREIISCTNVQEVVGNADIKIERICYDSRKASKNSLFVAIRGFRLDGHDFIEDAFCRGVRAFVVEKAVDFFRNFDFFEKAVWIKVPSTRKALAEISDFFYGSPSNRLKVVGVTGTKGKTTVTYFLQSIFNKRQIKTARLSTINYDVGGEIIPAPLTTPESVDLQMYLKKCVDREIPYVFMEVSSHSLVLHRVEKINFRAAVFTNLSPEHLDFHRNMEEYLRAKTILFENMPSEGNAFFNIDDKKSEKIIKKTSCRIFTYGIENKADFRAENIKVEEQRTFFQVKIKGKKEDFELHIPGIHNIYNALAAIGVAVSEDIPVEFIKKGLSEIRVIPGRMEPVENKANIRIYVDYAHTPS
ncbi:UDP-N-acetylmuramoyl-L-alanyl-D-glutamate--2,6-diaminopimelate ligase, partial [Candidatus Aerophobetes bacterium]|nr:UDP-N-acetylmuramoyl-L-alanyl-D-glutamate--2,6-diaminopimelate ligase [Candidatus Aerophobetes bacterium]